MRKPSIFSKDYEKIMRKRKRKKIIFIVVFFVIVGILGSKVSKVDFSKVKNRLQQWVDEGEKIENGDELAVENNGLSEAEEVNKTMEEKEVPEEKYLDVTISNINISFKLKEENSETLIDSVKETPENFNIKIWNNGKSALVLDGNQNINLVYSSGEVKNLTLPQYVGPDGDIFVKDEIINLYQGYEWHKDPVQISDNKIIYVTNIPYFGYNLSEYISVIDIENNTHTTIWNSKANKIIIGEMKDKGLEVTIDGNVKYINGNGELIL